MKTAQAIIENHGDFQTHQGFWDCECEHNYIHPKTQKTCRKCNTKEDEQPDSRVNELLAQGFITKNDIKKAKVI
jgi:hypothetical protein